MYIPFLIVLCAFLLGYFSYTNSSKISDDVYQVMGVECPPNEVVSCTIIKCPAGRPCPAAKFCFDPECVCRQGFRRIKGACMPKHKSLGLNKANLESSLLEIPYREEF